MSWKTLEFLQSRDLYSGLIFVLSSCVAAWHLPEIISPSDSTTWLQYKSLALCGWVSKSQTRRRIFGGIVELTLHVVTQLSGPREGMEHGEGHKSCNWQLSISIRLDRCCSCCTSFWWLLLIKAWVLFWLSGDVRSCHDTFWTSAQIFCDFKFQFFLMISEEFYYLCFEMNEQK